MKTDNTKIKDILQKKSFRIAAWAVLGVAVVLIIVIISIKTSKKDETVYRETTVTKGNLTVGEEVDGTVSVGTTTQSLDIDISEYTGSTSFSFDNLNSMGSGGGGGMPGADMSMGGMGGDSSGGDMFGNSSSSTASGDRTLETEAVYVSVGQEIKAGDPVLKLSEESVEEIRSKLEEDVTNAEVTYKQQTTEAELADLSAEQTLESNTNKGTSAQLEYDQTVDDLQKDVDDAQESLDDAQEKLSELEEQLEDYQGRVTEYKQVLDNANYTVNNIAVRDNVYGWTTAENAREDAQKMYDDLLDNIETTQEDIETQKDTVADCESSLAKAVYLQKTGLIDAQAVYDKAMLENSNAEEIYEVNVQETDLSSEIAQDDYEEAKEKLEEFNSCIEGQTIVSQYDGVVTEVMVSVGDYIGTGTEIMTVNDNNDVTITVDVEEENIEYAAEGSKANVYIDALPDEEFTAEVTEVGDASYDSSTGITYYEVTVTLSGNTDLLYEGMNAEVTFISKESEQVVYVSNRAVYRENGKSYVKMKDAGGNIIEQQIETGFSDGNNVEVLSGLNEGDVVLIESKVSD